MCNPGGRVLTKRGRSVLIAPTGPQEFQGARGPSGERLWREHAGNWRGNHGWWYADRGSRPAHRAARGWREGRPHGRRSPAGQRVYRRASRRSCCRAARGRREGCPHGRRSPAGQRVYKRASRRGPLSGCRGAVARQACIAPGAVVGLPGRGGQSSVCRAGSRWRPARWRACAGAGSARMGARCGNENDRRAGLRRWGGLPGGSI